MWRREDWKNPYPNGSGRARVYGEKYCIYESGADAMHLADVKYLEEHKVLVNFMEEGKVSITFKSSIKDWLAFTGRGVV